MIEIKDYSGSFGSPIAVFSPKNSSELISFLHKNGTAKFRIGGGLSGVSGGAVPKTNELFIDFTFYKSIHWIDKNEGVFSAAAGNTMREIKDFVEAEGWHFPVLPGSLDLATLGGMIACNGGGPYSLKYGKIDRFVRGLEIIKVNGDVMSMGSLSKKISEGPDFTKLFIGSEGTLGFISHAILTCTRIPEIELFRISHPSFSVLTDEIKAFLAYSPIFLEMAEPDALRFSSKKNEAVIWLGVEKGTEIPMTKYAHLNIEVKQINAISERFDIGFNLQDYKRFIDFDISFPLKNTTKLLTELKSHLNKHHLTSAFFGHAGDGNWHIHVFHEQSEKIKDEVIDDFDFILKKYNGHISGEHGIGEIHKNRFIKMKDKAHQDLYKSIKSHLDPNFQLPSLY
jgi:FAD/FMN-containing dehydrogenase